MFKRRRKPSFLKRLKSWLWPEGGWKRYGRYILLRLQRLKGTPREIAAGVACGVCSGQYFGQRHRNRGRQPLDLSFHLGFGFVYRTLVFRGNDFRCQSRIPQSF